MVSGVARPVAVLKRIADAMALTLREAARDDRIPVELLASMSPVWQDGLACAA